MATTTQAKPAVRKKAVKQVTKGRIYVLASFNNTILSLTDHLGNVIAWSSAGSSGFKGARRSTPYAATLTAQKLMDKARAFGLHEVAVTVSGVGAGRDAALRAFSQAGLNISAIKDNTPIPHNGCRQKKPRRV